MGFSFPRDIHLPGMPFGASTGDPFWALLRGVEDHMCKFVSSHSAHYRILLIASCNKVCFRNGTKALLSSSHSSSDDELELYLFLS